jgi:tetratricopeptide (TPR) repeat protein
MKMLKQSLLLLLTATTLTVAAQTKEITSAFALSYDYEAIQKYDAAIKSITPVYNASSYEMNLRMGWLHYLSAKHKDAIGYYQKAIQLMPAATEPHWAIINPLTKLESWVEIEKTYLAILKLDAKNGSANYNLAMIYYYRKDYLNAKKYFDVALNLTPFNYNNMLMSAWTNYFLGNKNEAKALFNKVLLYSPNDKSALEGLGLIK